MKTKRIFHRRRIFVVAGITTLVSIVSGVTLTSCGSKDAKPADGQIAAISSANKRVTSDEITKVVALGRVEPEDQITALGTETGGIVKRVFVSDGASVKAGEPLLELTHDVETARLVLAQARARTQAEEIKVIRAQAASARIKAQTGKDRYDRLNNMFRTGAETLQNLDNAKADYETALREEERLNASLQAAESRLAEQNAEVRIAAAEVERRIVRAPSDGIVLKLLPNSGSPVVSGTSVGDFAPKGFMTVLCEVDELFVTRVAEGQKAGIRTQGTSNILAEGTVIAVGPYLKKKSLFSDEAGALEDRRVREVRIRLDNPGALLLNSRVEAVIAVR